MSKLSISILSVVAVGVVTLTTSIAAANVTSAFMDTGQETSQPIGHYEFCQHLPAECSVQNGASLPVALDEGSWTQLQFINNLVNEAIQPATDEEMFGTPEVWSFPSIRGDCEDYVLLKRRLLVEHGWPIGALLITVVLRPDGSGHAVLTVRTDRGDLVLDNLTPQIRVWTETPYRFVKRQSDRDTGRWVAILNGGGGDVRFVGN